MTSAQELRLAALQREEQAKYSRRKAAAQPPAPQLPERTFAKLGGGVRINPDYVLALESLCRQQREALQKIMNNTEEPYTIGIASAALAGKGE